MRMFCGGMWLFCGCYMEHCGGMWMFCGCYVEHCGGMWMFCGCYVEHCGGMWMLCGRLWRNMDDLWSNVDVMWNIVEECGCFVEQCRCYVEHCGGMWMFYGCYVEHYGGMWMFCGESGCNVDPPHLHISQFDHVLSPPWSVILKYAIVDVMWIHQIFTLTIKWTADPFCRLYSSVHLLSVYWSCIWSLYCTRALALLYNVSLEALKSLLSLLVLYLKNLNA